MQRRRSAFDPFPDDNVDLNQRSNSNGMQRRRSAFEPFPETVDLNQGSNSNSMDESDDWSILSPTERRLLNNDLSNELNFGCVNVNTNSRNSIRSLSGWDVGESSSRGSIQDHVNNDGLKTEPNWLTSGTRDLGLSEKQQVESLTSYPHDSFIAGHVAMGPSNLQSSESNRIPMNVNLNIGYEDSNSDDEDGMGFIDFHKSSETEAAGSCKRKTLEGTSAQSRVTGAGSSCFPQAEDIARPHAYNGSRSLNISSTSVNPVPMNRHEQPSTRIGVGTSVPLVPESSQSHFGPRGSVPYNNLSSSGNSNRRPNISSSHDRQSNRQILLNEFLDHTNRGPTVIQPNLSNNSSNPQPLLMPVPTLPRTAPHFLWGNNTGSRTGSSSNSPAVPLERGSEANFRSMLRNNMQYHSFVPPSETRNLVQDPTNWSLATGNASSNVGGASSSSRNASGSGGPQSFNAIRTTPSLQRSFELPPWNLFPSADPESGNHRCQFPAFPSGSSTSEDNPISSGPSQRHQHQPFSRSGLLMELPGADLRVLDADMDGRQRMVSEIRQVLHAMRRGGNLRAEDYMLFDPFINGLAEMHDRHREMRLDVDNMSYEELLALEERIGDVKTGLSEEVILKSMKQRRHVASMATSTQVLEPCCICQEEYETDDNIGSLDCGHDFHTDCIVQWLTQKNVCPICKMTGIAP
ncbi:E3 ubiquitin protein ligase MBR2-like protein [Tanacetum coccineum]